MSLSLSRVTSVWAAALAKLQPVPDDKLQVLLRVCVGDRGQETAPGPRDAGAVLQRIMPLTMFLDTSHGKVSGRRGWQDCCM
jgi:hypothetical protein